MIWIVGILLGIICYLVYEISVYDRKMKDFTERIQDINEKFSAFYGDGR